MKRYPIPRCLSLRAELFNFLINLINLTHSLTPSLLLLYLPWQVPTATVGYSTYMLPLAVSNHLELQRMPLLFSSLQHRSMHCQPRKVRFLSTKAHTPTLFWACNFAAESGLAHLWWWWTLSAYQVVQTGLLPKHPRNLCRLDRAPKGSKPIDGGCARKTLTCPRRIPFSTLVQSMADAALHSERPGRAARDHCASGPDVMIREQFDVILP